MKSTISLWTIAISLLAVLAIPIQIFAQEQTEEEHHAKHHHYKLIDLGTFGGPQSRADYPVALNNHGTVAGSADTPHPNPFYGNDNPFFFPDPYIEHAFQWKDGFLTDLGSLPGGGTSLPNWINERGDVAGQATNSVIDPLTGWPESVAVLYKDGQVINLGTLGGNESLATAVNDRDQVVGFAANTIPDPFSPFVTQVRAFLWQDGVMKDLGTLGTGTDAVALAMNERGQIVGNSFTNTIANPVTGSPTSDPFLWQNGTMIDLGTLGGTSSDTIDGPFVNRRGQVVGSSNLAGDIHFHPFLWTKPGPMTDLGTLGGNDGQANSINDASEVVGWATNAGDLAVLAFLWRNGTMRNLGTVDGDPCSIAWGINSKRQIGGASWDCGANYTHAFLWENGGPSVDLNTLVPRGSGVQLTVASPNERGEIIAEGLLPNGDNHAFLLIPCDENHGDDEDCMGNAEEAAAVLQSTPPLNQELIKGARPRLSPEIRLTPEMLTALRPHWRPCYFALAARHNTTQRK